MENNKTLKTFKLKEFIDAKFPKRDCIMSPFIHEKSLNMIYAYRGAGKTMLSLAMAYSIATGNDLLKWKVDKPTKVLYIDGEMPIEALQERLTRIKKGFNRNEEYEDNLVLLSADCQNDIFLDIATIESQILIEQTIEDNEIKLVFIDNLSTLSNTKENEADDWYCIQEWLLKLRRSGVSVILIHHAGKGGQQRGTSRREDALDTVICLSKTKGDSTKLDITFEKCRNIAESNLNFEAELKDNSDESLSWEYLDTDEFMESLRNKGFSIREIEKMTGIPRSTIQRKLN